MRPFILLTGLLLSIYAHSNDIAGAERFLSEGYAALSEWTGTLASSAELEKKLLDRLSSRIAQAKTAPQPYIVSDNRIM